MAFSSFSLLERGNTIDMKTLDYLPRPQNRIFYFRPFKSKIPGSSIIRQMHDKGQRLAVPK